MTIKSVNDRMYLFVLVPRAALLSPHPRRSCLRALFLCYGVNFRDVSSRELYDNGLSFVVLIRRYEHVDAARFCLGERVRQIRHLIPGHLSAVRNRKATVGNPRVL